MDKTYQRKHVPVVAVLRACRDFHAKQIDVVPMERLCRFGPEKVIVSRLAQLESKGLIESGVSLRTAWLTPKGEALLVELEATL